MNARIIGSDVRGTAAALARGALAGSLMLGCMGQTEGETEANGPRLQVAAASSMRTAVRRVGGTVEVEVTSDQPFRYGAMPPVLIIGDKAFGSSKSPPDGRLDSLIFMIDAAAFDALPENANVSFGYLSPTARLVSKVPASGAVGTANAVQSSPGIRPDQVEQNKQQLGTLRKSAMAVQP